MRLGRISLSPMANGFVDISAIDPDHTAVSEEELRSMLPHDHEFRLVDRICHLDPEQTIAVGYKDWDDNPWWAKGHVPGRPLMPGVLMIEGCAQVATILMKCMPQGWDPNQFIGMGGVDNARFRRPVTPPARIFFCAQTTKVSRKISRFRAEAYCNSERVMEMDLVGIVL